MTVCFLINRYTNGGIERVVTRLANHLVRSETANPIILTLFPNPEDLGLDSSVPLRSLGFVHTTDVATSNASGKKRSTPRKERIRRLYFAIQEMQPDLVLSFGTATNLLAISAGVHDLTRLKVAERTNFYAVSLVKRVVRRWAYRRADAVVVQTERQRRRFRRHNRFVTVIPNPVVVPEVVPPPDERESVILLVGRLATVKQFDRFLTEVHIDRLDGWRIRIIGEGPQRELIETIIRDRGLGDRVTLVGYRPDVSDELGRAAIFVLCSKFEGFPNALAEALAAGLSCVSFNLESGPETLIDDGVSGVLVPDQDWKALNDALYHLTSSLTERQRYYVNARSAMRRFGISSIAKEWIV